MQSIQKYIQNNKCLVVIVSIYILARIFLININYTEWGDSFRMIRAAEYISNLSWPWDEKRWPFYSLLLVPGIWMDMAILWGRIISLFSSIGLLIIVYEFYIKFLSPNKFYALIAVIFTATSSVFAYWSLRVMADPVFAFLVILFMYLFLSFYNKPVISIKIKLILSLLLICITMTRLEGLFVLSAIGLYLLINFYKTHRYTDLIIYGLPQILIYFPWTIYAKFIYSGDVSNDYLQEAKTFVFNIDWLLYFLAYSAFILVMPITAYFVYQGIFRFKQKIYDKERLIWMVPVLFIAQEFVIGFLWTPSLPRIYMPVIPFLSMVLAYGIQSINPKKIIKSEFIIINIMLLGVFIFSQIKFRLYFLGASKVLFALIILSGIFFIFWIFFNRYKYFKRILLVGLIFMNLCISFVVVHNQKDIYKTVVASIEYLNEYSGVVAYSDETGNTEWYLRNNSFYLNQNERFNSIDEQYELLKEKNIDYVIITNEFNRGSSFIDPKSDDRFSLIFVDNQQIVDPFDKLLKMLKIKMDDDYHVFTSKVYEVK